MISTYGFILIIFVYYIFACQKINKKFAYVGVDQLLAPLYLEENQYPIQILLKFLKILLYMNQGF